MKFTMPIIQVCHYKKSKFNLFSEIIKNFDIIYVDVLRKSCAKSYHPAESCQLCTIDNTYKVYPGGLLSLENKKKYYKSLILSSNAQNKSVNVCYMF